MRLSDYKTGMILKDVNGYTLVLGILDSVVEVAKKEIEHYGIYMQWVKPNQIVAAKLEWEYRIFLVEDTRTIEFIEPDLSITTNLVNIDFLYMDRIEEPLVQANEYYLLGEVR